MRNIHFWHGEDEKLRNKLLEIDGVEWENVDSGTNLVYVGTLDNFAEKYNDKFIVLGTTIAVTQHGNFGQR